jgi:hypothetical protein
VAGIVNLSGRGMLLVSVARQLGSGNSFASLLCCPLKPSGAGKRCPRSAKLTMPQSDMTEEEGSEIASPARASPTDRQPYSVEPPILSN